MLNFMFLVCKLVLVNPDNTRTKSAANLNYCTLSAARITRDLPDTVNYQVRFEKSQTRIKFEVIRKIIKESRTNDVQSVKAKS